MLQSNSCKKTLHVGATISAMCSSTNVGDTRDAHSRAFRLYDPAQTWKHVIGAGKKGFERKLVGVLFKKCTHIGLNKSGPAAAQTVGASFPRNRLPCKRFSRGSDPSSVFKYCLEVLDCFCVVINKIRATEDAVSLSATGAKTKSKWTCSSKYPVRICAEHFSYNGCIDHSSSFCCVSVCRTLYALHKGNAPTGPWYTGQTLMVETKAAWFEPCKSKLGRESCPLGQQSSLSAVKIQCFLFYPMLFRSILSNFIQFYHWFIPI